MKATLNSKASRTKLVSVLALLVINCSSGFAAATDAGTTQTASLFTWSNPMMFVLLGIVGFALYSVQTIIRTHRFLADAGAAPTYDVFGGVFKWTAKHQKSVAVIMIIIILSAILFAI